MLNQSDILQTLDMIDHQHLDIRTIIVLDEFDYSEDLFEGMETKADLEGHIYAWKK